MDTPVLTLGFLPNIGPMEWLVIGLVLLLLFGSRLPEVGRGLGKGIIEFKKGLKGVEDDMEVGQNQQRQSYQQQLPPNTQTQPPMAGGQGQAQRVSRSDEA
jgi:sec-independent protein translocase protein TatA